VIEQENAKMLNLIAIREQLETTLSNVQHHAAVSDVAQVMKGLALNPDEVEKTQESLQDIMDDQKAISEMMAQPLSAADDVDYDALDAYYEEAVEEVLFEQFDYFIIFANSVSQGAAQEASLPALQPAVQQSLNLPSAGKKQVPQKTAAQKESEDELDRCRFMRISFSVFVFTARLQDCGINGINSFAYALFETIQHCSVQLVQGIFHCCIRTIYHAFICIVRPPIRDCKLIFVCLWAILNHVVKSSATITWVQLVSARERSSEWRGLI
jgi:hypothetical protein